jgi:hypothetical protein
MPCNPRDFPIFTSPDKETIRRALLKISNYLRIFSTKTGLTDIAAHDTILYDIIDRIEKRRVYFHIFYNGCEMGEPNEAALLCFWILKRMPFFSPALPAPILNTKIALYVFIGVLTYLRNTEGTVIAISDQAIKDLYYAFCYRDLSKEAIMLLVKSFSE